LPAWRSATICTDLEVRQIEPATLAHIHRGAAGPAVVNLDPPDDNDSDDCDEAPDALVDEIRRNPGAFFVDVHTADFPNGAIGGTLVNEPG
jgi:hypothetical protein